ncbi:phasin family protein [uncultured Thiodictyon sp.]|uniref:phasin family protein n=1 Tax=uncultured Thiodictyon sp. TaxID=1846217 RepID=UPI0025F17E65|nr:phasin family protein [uncultured Thiodictyon sp.]
MTATDTFNTVNEITNKGVERMSSLGELNLRIFERMATRQVDAMNLAVEHSVRLTKLATESKGVTEFFKAQAEAAKELSERVLSESKINMQLAGQARDDYRVWFEKNLADVSADLRKAVPAV